MAGLMALLTILTAVPGRLEGQPLRLELPGTAQGLERAGVGVWVPPPEAIRQLLDLIKQGERQYCSTARSGAVLLLGPDMRDPIRAQSVANLRLFAWVWVRLT